MQIFSVLFMALAMSANFVYAGEVLPNRLSKALFCQTMLWAGNQAPSTKLVLPSLRELQYRLSRLTTEPGSPQMDASAALYLQGDLSRPGQRVFFQHNLQLARARLQGLDNDLTAGKADPIVVAYEYRGVEAVRQARDLMVKELTDMNPRVLNELKSRYPVWRWPNLLRHGLSLSAAGMLLDPTFFTGALAVGTLLLNEVAVPVVQLGLGGAGAMDEQIKIIDGALNEPSLQYPFSIFSGALVVHEDLHRTLIDPKKTELDDQDFYHIVDASELLRTLPFDDSAKSRLAEGATRVIYFDSLFYVDVESLEPVWIHVYRAFKSVRPARKKPRKREEKRALPQWEPGLVPVPVRSR